jgi:molybdopterin converting factor small subunit
MWLRNWQKFNRYFGNQGQNRIMEKSVSKVELNIRPPLSYDVSKKSGGITIHSDVFEGENLGGLIARLANQTPRAFRRLYDPAKGEIFPPVITVVNGAIVNRADALEKELFDGDKITWFLMYAGG